jgi:aspartyl-tRNA(Asn)/glutamyl-tRNA(Gln) amidotransferase subunit B
MNAMKTLIGLEIHTQLGTKTKMFCRCANVPDVAGLEPNIHVCPICLGMPGSLPTINAQAVDFAIKAGLALNCTIAKHSRFDRKNYFYPDLPKGYQISQYDMPICGPGYLEIQTASGPKKIRLRRIHLEEDAAKSSHPADADFSLIDFNRAGTPLIESVSDPDMSTPEEARLFAQAVRTIYRYIGISDADMEKGQLRVDANISVNENGRTTPITEIKNINSFRSIERALTYEIKRHAEMLKAGKEGEMIKETRGWVDERGETVSQRSKEQMSDYRYFPEPDLPPLEPDQEHVRKLKAALPELPAAKSERFMKEYGMSASHADQLVADRAYAEFFEETMSELEAWVDSSGEKVGQAAHKKLAKMAVNWILVELTKHLNKARMEMENVRITPENFAEFLKMIHRNEINSSAAQTILSHMFLRGSDPSTVAKDENLLQISDTGELEKVLEKVIAANPKPVEDVKAGKAKAMQFLVGQVMKETKGKANPGIIQDLLRKKLA